MSAACCGSARIRIIEVGNSRAGVTGLDRLIDQVFIEGWSPHDEGLGKRLVEGLRAAGNFVAGSAEDDYAKALFALYQAHVEAQQRLRPNPSPSTKR